MDARMILDHLLGCICKVSLTVLVFDKFRLPISATDVVVQKIATREMMIFTAERRFIGFLFE